MSDFPDLVAPWQRVPLVHDTTDLFPTETMDALDARYIAAGGVPDASTTVKGIVELATDAETVTGTDTTRATTPSGVAAALATVTVPDASTTVKGIVELATDAETVTGTDTTRATTPSGVAAALAALDTSPPPVPFPVATACAVGSYMPTIPQTQATSTVSLSITDTYSYRFTPSVDMTADRVAVYVSTGSATGLIRLGVYADADGTGRIPGALIADWGTVAAGAASGVYKEITISQAFTAGTIYWLAYCGEVGSPVMRSTNANTAGGLLPRLIAGTQADALAPPAAYAAQKTGVGAFPDPWSGTAYGGGTLLSIAFRRSV